MQSASIKNVGAIGSGLEIYKNEVPGFFTWYLLDINVFALVG